jgi:hypothetical protein
MGRVKIETLVKSAFLDPLTLIIFVGWAAPGFIWQFVSAKENKRVSKFKKASKCSKEKRIKKKRIKWTGQK